MLFSMSGFTGEDRGEGRGTTGQTATQALARQIGPFSKVLLVDGENLAQWFGEAGSRREDPPDVLILLLNLCDDQWDLRKY